MPVLSNDQKESEKISQLITNSADISALLSEFPAPQDASSGGPKRKKIRAEQPDLSQYQSGSSSSGNSSPQHEDEDDSFRVTDVDMWEVLEALELPAPDEGLQPASADLDVSLNDSQRSSPSMMGAASQNTAADPEELVVLPVTGLAGSVLGFSSQPVSGAANKRSAPGGAPRPATTPIKASSKVVSKTGAVVPKQDAPEAPEPKDEGSDLEDDGGELNSSNDPAEEKRLKRMRRNRESAAMSRNRKKAYIEELETKVTSLTSMVQALQSENWALKEENNALRSGKGHVAPLDSVDTRQLVSAAPPACSAPATDATTTVTAGAGRKLGTAGLALASALTLVTLSVNSTPDGTGSLVGSRGHSPTSRVLMSLPEDLASMADPTGMADAAPLWPSLDLAHAEIEALESAPAAAMLLPPEEATSQPGPGVPLRKPSSKRVTHLPLNSSWADALRSEAAEHRHSSSMELTTHHSSGWDGKHEPSDVSADVLEAPWGDAHELFPDFDATSDASQRFIFCARSYAFDVLKTAKDDAKVPSTPSLPAAMPARFRHAAQASGPRQLADGSNNSGDAALSQLPVVNFLLPFDALSGGMAEMVRPKAARPDAQSDADLVQVTCQLLNASRFS